MRIKNCFVILLALQPLTVPAAAQDADSTVQARYSYQVQVINQHNEDVVHALNILLKSAQDENRRGTGRSLGSELQEEYTRMFIDKTLRATSGVISAGIDYLSVAAKTHTRAYRFAEWRKFVDGQNTVQEQIATEKPINDFYFLPSKEGSLDTGNLKFDGFSCYNYIETQQSLDGKSEAVGHDVFYVRCSLRKDRQGLESIAYHTKFLLQLDTLAFYPDYCSVPNDGKVRSRGHFDFRKRDNLSFQLTVNVFSSWISDDQQLNADQCLGTFVVTAQIPEESLREVDGERVFVYSAADPANRDRVGISGDCFVIPRSFIGADEDPSWGTGQYRLEFEVAQSCSVNPAYYQVAHPEKASGVRKWDKKKWKPEWRAMKRGDDSTTFLRNAWQQIKIAYIGGDWVEEVVSPVAAALYEKEATLLRKALIPDD